MQKLEIRAILLIFVLFFISFEALADETMLLEWSYKADSTITSLYSDDINLDSYEEIIFASYDKLYVFDKKGNLLKNYKLNSKGKAYAIKTTHLEDNKTKKIFVGFGWNERTPIRRQYLNLSADGSAITRGILYEKNLHKGELKIFDYVKTNETNKTEISGWIKEMIIADFDFDGENDIILITSGYDTFFYEEWVDWASEVKCSDFNYSSYQPPGYSCTPIYIEGLYCYRDCEPISNFTSTTLPKRYENKTGKIKEFYEETKKRSSIIVLSQNFTEKVNSTYEKIFLNADFLNFQNFRNIIISSDDKKIYSLSVMNFTEEWTYESPDDIKEVIVTDLQDDGVPEIILAYSGKISGVQGLTRSGEKFLDFRTPLGEDIVAISVHKLYAQDSEKKIFIITDKNFYVMELNGKTIIKQPILGMDKMLVSDFDKDNNTEVVLSKGEALYYYKILSEFSKESLADKLCENAKNSMDLNYTLARELAETAIKTYREINKSGKAEECYILMLEIEKRIFEKKKVEADTFYAKAVSFFAFEDYKKAEEFADNALEIYKEIADVNGIKNSNALLSKIREFYAPPTTIVTTTTFEETKTEIQTTILLTTTTTLPKQNQEVPTNTILLIALTILVILIIIWKKRERSEEKEFSEITREK
ncbi:MAG: tetratricopeptide repeat protein [Candidatus Altiarchaeota archaeon]